MITSFCSVPASARSSGSLTGRATNPELPDIETASFKKAAAPSRMIPKIFCTPELLAHIIWNNCNRYFFDTSTRKKNGKQRIPESKQLRFRDFSCFLLLKGTGTVRKRSYSCLFRILKG